LLTSADVDEHACVHRPQSPAARVAVAAFFVVLAAGVVLVVSLASGRGPEVGSGLVALGSFLSAGALFRMRTRASARRPPR
jgi:hypothetical protein